MDVTSATSVLRCARCNKPFDKEASLKRHGYYCRSRNGAPVARVRSCVTCARVKARCDHQRPGCSRCILKGITCSYPSTAQRRRHASPQTQDVSSSSPSFNESASSGADTGLNVEKAQDPETRVTFTSDALFEGIDYSEWLEADMIASGMETEHFGLDFDQAMFSPGIAIPPQPTQAVRSLVIRQRSKISAQGITSLITSTLKSYPLMLLRHNSLPPFIHPRWLSSQADSTQTEPLTNCISLMHMASSGVQGSRKLFWKNVRAECEWICQGVHEMEKSGLLATLQALSIYILVRLGEGETDHNNLDSLLLRAVTLTAVEFSNQDPLCNTYSATREGIWDEWIFQESRRRLCVIYRVVNLLVYFEPVVICNLTSELLVAPLPSKKQLWEASNVTTWKAEHEAGSYKHVDYGLAADGELVEVDQDNIYMSSSPYLRGRPKPRAFTRKVAKWEEWCAGMDGLGGLVMLAASLLS